MKQLALWMLFSIGFAAGAEGGAAPLPLSAYGPHAVGYRVGLLQDASRSVGPRRPGLQPRSVTLHLWYPAREAAKSLMTYQEYLWLAAGGDSSQEKRRTEILTAYKAAPLARGADERELDAHLNRPTRARLDAAPASGPFPLILYAPSINSEPFENADLFEFLASHGYVVASAPCLGWQEAATERNRLGSLSQYSDLGLVLNSALREPFVDANHVGVMGFSWGGMNGLLLALAQQGIDALVNLDGAQGFAAYSPIAESSPLWSPQRLLSPVLYILPVEEERNAVFFDQTLYADTYIWRIKGFSHRDFAAELIASRRRALHDPNTAQVEAAYSRIAATLKQFFDSYLKNDRTSLEGLSSGPQAGAEWSARKALPPPPSPSQFAAVIENQGVDQAVAMFRRLRQADPGLLLLEEPTLLEYATLWGPERSDELLKLLGINLEMYPRSAATYLWLAQVHLAKNDKPSALNCLDALLNIEPGHAKAIRLKQQLLAGE